MGAGTNSIRVDLELTAAGAALRLEGRAKTRYIENSGEEWRSFCAKTRSYELKRCWVVIGQLDFGPARKMYYYEIDTYLDAGLYVVVLKIGQLPALRKISLHDNVLAGAIPWSLGFLPSFRGVYLFNNRLSGSIPSPIGNCPLLQTLDLSNNALIGTIPPSLANSTKPFRFNLCFKSLTGSLPNSLTQSPSLTILALQPNNLSGSIPNTWGRTGNNTYNLQLCGYSSSTPCPSPPPENLPAPPKGAPKWHHRKLSTKDKILIAAGALLAALLVLCCILLCCLIRKRATSKGIEWQNCQGVAAGSFDKAVSAGAHVQLMGETGGKLVHFDGPFVFTADNLLYATAEIMGKSAYRTTYKATLDDGNQVAVKRSREKSTKGLVRLPKRSGYQKYMVRKL
ncbi:putative leucine-rich repeat receptor-like protein kinase IMK3 [Morella rubra]|uniref:Putative leucine-rich repeat receptor-like protein kinase IMK3 n=1 Tax=Morella rubra TaxID=262757 RepID=A0A6A1UG48_9ROSI|nr:putative leucine-rich repeat receptor-like protein kinase IMK3 [Morella rubra]